MTKKTNYFINWIGGKRLLRKTISELIPDDIKSYIEVFGGGAWVLFYKERWANLEVYNDLDNNLFNLFSVVKYHEAEFCKEFLYMLNSRKLFNIMRDYIPITDIQRAAKFFFLLQRSYGAKRGQFAYVRNGASGSSKSQPNIIERVRCAASRLDKVIIERKSSSPPFRLAPRKPPLPLTKRYSIVLFGRVLSNTPLKRLAQRICGRHSCRIAEQ